MIPPKDGTVILGEFRELLGLHPATYSKAAKAWCVAILQVDLYEGEYSDYYFENEFIENNDLLTWQPMPTTKQEA